MDVARGRWRLRGVTDDEVERLFVFEAQSSAIPLAEDEASVAAYVALGWTCTAIARQLGIASALASSLNERLQHSLGMESPEALAQLTALLGAHATDRTAGRSSTFLRFEHSGAEWAVRPLVFDDGRFGTLATRLT
jgi:hypothetical protein